MYEDQIAAGMMQIEREFGDDFHLKLDVDRLDMNDVYWCVVGQLVRQRSNEKMDYWHWSGTKPRADLLDCGFELPGTGAGHRYDDLTVEWRRAILARIGVHEVI